jgi:hypothetical protein
VGLVNEWLEESETMFWRGNEELKFLDSNVLGNDCLI